MLTQTEFPGLLVIEPVVYEDNRGYFFESYNESHFQSLGIPVSFVQDNESYSRHGVIRGLHYQVLPHAQAKLVRVVSGAVLDVAVDLRKGSPTFGKTFAIELTEANRKQLFIPHGFAHGFSVLSEEAKVIYKCDALYNREAEAGIRHDDPVLNISWGIDKDKRIISEKDKLLPSFADCRNNFEFHP